MIDFDNPIRQAVDPFSGRPKANEQMRMKLDNHLKEQVIATFSTPHGLQLLDTLEDLYIRQPVCPPGSPEGYGYMREGENRLILKLRSIINSSQKQGAV